MNPCVLKTALTDEERRPNGQLKELWLEVGPACHLACSYCFSAAGGTILHNNGISLAQYLDVLAQFKDLGGKFVGMPGFGEPFHSQNIKTTLGILEKAARLGLRSHVFSAGDLITDDIARKLKDMSVSLGIKFNSFNPGLQDSLVNSPGYSERRDKALKILARLRFNCPETRGRTLLAFVTSVMRRNHKEIPSIYRFCRENNIFPDMDSMLLPFGRADLITAEDEQIAKRTFAILRKIDEEEYGYRWESNSPCYAGAACDRCYYHLYIDYRGNISPCLGANKKEVYLGNVGRQSLEEMWASPLMKKIRQRDYAGKCAECAHFKNNTCNSCLGRFASELSVARIDTKGCWNFLSTS